MGKADLKWNKLEEQKRERNTAQMKEQSRNAQYQINKEEISNLPERGFRIMIVKMLWRHENRFDKMQETFNTVNTIAKEKE